MSQYEGRPRAELPVEHLHEMAEIERLLRRDTRSLEPHLIIGDTGTRITWESWCHNLHARGSVTATVANEIVHTEAWGLATIHDPTEHGENGNRRLSRLSVVYDPPEDNQ